MYCTYCNHQNIEGNKFCENCGKPLVIRQQATPPPAPQTPRRSQMNRPFLRAGLIGGVILAIIALLGLRLDLACLALPLALLAELVVGVLAAYWLPPRRSIGRAAGQGALAGIIAGLISSVVTVILTSEFTNPGVTQAELSMWQPTPAMFLQDALVGAVLCTLGALIFAAIKPE